MIQKISKRVSLSSLTKAISAFVHHGRAKTPESIQPTLQEQLDTAQPAEELWDAFSYPNVHTDPGDGIWICECGFENHVIHYQGSYPFKYLVCQRCEHIMSPYDTTSEALTSIPCIAKEIFEDRFIQQQNVDVSRYCRSCRCCGLTQRASVVGTSILFGQLPCLCSETDEKKPMYFYIGDVESYRHDPDGAAVELSIKRRLEASMRYLDRRGIQKSTVHWLEYYPE